MKTVTRAISLFLQDHLRDDREDKVFSLIVKASLLILFPQTIREATRKIQKLGVAGKHECDLPPDIEAKLDDQRLIIRRAETSKAKMEARIELLKEGGGERWKD